jgi:hypothetical protein
MFCHTRHSVFMCGRLIDEELCQLPHISSQTHTDGREGVHHPVLILLQPRTFHRAASVHTWKSQHYLAVITLTVW